MQVSSEGREAEGTCRYPAKARPEVLARESLI
jgi:hypothetical protein